MQAISTTEAIPSRHRAHIFDLQVEGPPKDHGVDASPDAIGGYFGCGWYEYFRDHVTGEIYQVHCSDGVYGGNDSHTPDDEILRTYCHYELFKRFVAAAASGSAEIRISLHERIIVQSKTHSCLLETAEGKGDGKQSKDGLEGGLFGHFRGIPVICDPTLKDGAWSTLIVSATEVEDMSAFVRALKPGNRVQLVFADNRFSGNLRGMLMSIMHFFEEQGGLPMYEFEYRQLLAVANAGRWGRDERDYTVIVGEGFAANDFIEQAITRGLFQVVRLT
jgi:hypothetical protein